MKKQELNVGNNVTLAPEIILSCHDGSTKKVIDYLKIGIVSIGNNVFIGAISVILPGFVLVTIQ